MDNALEATFQKKYDEFAADLRGTFPEVEMEIVVAAALKAPDSIKRYTKEVLGKHAEMTPDVLCPGMVLPGVQIEPSMWKDVSVSTKRKVYEYLSILDLCAMYENGLDGIENEGKFKQWAEKITGEWRSRLDKVDFDSLGDKFKSMFGAGGALPQLPEKFLKGKLAKLAEDMVKEFKPEDFGLRPEDLEAVERDPTRAFEILMQASATNPHLLQTAMTRVGKKLQNKIQSGQLKPQELAAEAEELMHEFQSHPAFAEMMKAFKGAFDHPAAQRGGGGGGDSARLNLVKERLRAKLAAKQAAKKDGGK
jgi:hypothetical protein